MVPVEPPDAKCRSTGSIAGRALRQANDSKSYAAASFSLITKYSSPERTKTRRKPTEARPGCKARGSRGGISISGLLWNRWSGGIAERGRNNSTLGGIQRGHDQYTRRTTNDQCPSPNDQRIPKP